MKYLSIILVSLMLISCHKKTPIVQTPIDCNNLAPALKGKTLAEQQAIADQCFTSGTYTKSRDIRWTV